MYKLYWEKAEEPEVKLPTSFGSLKKQESSRKTSTSASLTMPKPFFFFFKCQRLWLWRSQWTVENSRNGNTRSPYLPLEKSVCRSRSNVRTGHRTTDWFQIGKGVHQGCILSPYLFNLYAESIWRRQWQPTPVLLPGKSCGRRSLVDYSPWGR